MNLSSLQNVRAASAWGARWAHPGWASLGAPMGASLGAPRTHGGLVGRTQGGTKAGKTCSPIPATWRFHGVSHATAAVDWTEACFRWFMSNPRRVLPQCTQLVTRRTVERKFLLRPSEEVCAIFRYLIALLAARHGVAVHAFVVLSNHLHLLKTDGQAEMPAFMRDLLAQATRRLNCVLDREGPLWDSRRYSSVEVHGEGAAWDKLVYVMTNPVKHGLVSRPEDWPGLITLISEIRAGKVTVERPDLPCFRGSTLPRHVELELAPPPVLGHLSREEYADQLEQHVLERVRELNGCALSSNNAPLGAERALEADPDDCPVGCHQAGGLDPRISGLEESSAYHQELLEELKEWRRAYWEARRRWSSDSRVEFPYGTYAMRVHYNARVAPPPRL